MNMHKTPEVKDFCERLYAELEKQNYDVYFDDRNERPGVMFADAELIGIPYQIVVGAKNLANNTVEFKNRITGEKSMISTDNLMEELKKLLGK